MRLPPSAIGNRVSSRQPYLAFMDETTALNHGASSAIPQTTINGTGALPDFDPAIFAAWLRETGSTDNTVSQYVRATSRWLDFLGGTSVAPAVAWLRWGARPGERRLTGFAVRRYCEFLLALGITADFGIPRRLPPCSRPNPMPIARITVRAMSLAAKRTFAEFHDSASMRVFIALLDELALRRSEAFFQWPSVNFADATVTILGKGGDTRRLPLSRRLVALLRWLRSRSPMFPWTDRRGRKLRADTMYRRYKRLARAIGRPALRLHWLRHGRLTSMAATPGRFDPIHLCAFSGHRQVQSLRHYCAPQMDRLRELMTLSLRRGSPGTARD